MRKYVFITILAAVLLCSCGGGGNWSGKMKTGDIHRVCDAVASWQMENFDRQPNGSDCFIADNQVHWSSAVLYSGMYRWAEYSGDERIFDFLRGIGDTNGWGLYSQRTPYHADDICVGQMYLDMYERYGEPEMMAATLERASFIAEHPSPSPLSKRDSIGRYDRWAWCDALFMAPPVYASLLRITRNNVFGDYMEREFRECTDSLFDGEAGLYYRDCIRREIREPNGEGEFWARGNAWVIAGIALTLDNLPETFDGRSYYEDIFRTMAASVVKCQCSDGSWHPSMKAPEHFPMPETSSSALFCFALAWGMNNGLLPESEYLPALKKGWNSLCSHVHPDGKIGFVQPIGAFPQNGITADDTQVYAVGGFLMVGAEISRMLDRPFLGQIVNKTLSQTSNDLTVGCETLDRDYADYHKYKEYLEPLGIRKIRLQAGWAKTERVKGVYDFAWLDSIIDDAVSRGLEPWLETSYGNPIYEGGGTPYLAGGWPVSDEAKAAWDNWVRAMAERYRGKVHEWEIWNEPDINKSQFEDWRSFVELTERTAGIIRSVDPEAKIAAFAWAYADPEMFDKCLETLAADGALDLIDWVTYHFYRYRPEDMYPEVERLQAVLSKYSDQIVMRQGETGAPSVGGLGGALEAYPWTEVSQAKWDLRRMLSDKGRGIPTTVFSISDFHYSTFDSIKLPNRKGLLETDGDNNVIRPKQAYFAVRNLATLWDEADVPDFSFTAVPDSPRNHSIYCFRDSETSLPSFALWHDSEIPGNSGHFVYESVTLEGATMSEPVAVDVRTGKVYRLVAVFSPDGKQILRRVPVYDSPVLIIEKKLISTVKKEYRIMSERKRLAFKMRLKPGFKEEYRKRHAALWPEMKALLKEGGISNYSIFFDEQSNTLFAYQEVEGEGSSQDMGALPIVQKWWDYMSDIMEVNPDKSPVSIPLEQVFYLE